MLLKDTDLLNAGNYNTKEENQVSIVLQKHS